MFSQEVNCTLFLLAGYIKYGRPYAWIRSNHERLVNIGGTVSMVKDTPMKLKSIADWQTRGTGSRGGGGFCRDSIIAPFSTSLMGRRCLHANLRRGYRVEWISLVERVQGGAGVT